MSGLFPSSQCRLGPQSLDIIIIEEIFKICNKFQTKVSPITYLKLVQIYMDHASIFQEETNFDYLKGPKYQPNSALLIPIYYCPAL